MRNTVFKNILISAVGLTLLTGCFSNGVSCSSKETRNSVEEVINENIASILTNSGNTSLAGFYLEVMGAVMAAGNTNKAQGNPERMSSSVTLELSDIVQEGKTGAGGAICSAKTTVVADFRWLRNDQTDEVKETRSYGIFTEVRRVSFRATYTASQAQDNKRIIVQISDIK